jgi:pimeloyl-ACP methyl ester carboxylesterase
MRKLKFLSALLCLIFGMSLVSDGQQVWESDNMAFPTSLSPQVTSIAVMAKHQETCDSIAIDHFDSGASIKPVTSYAEMNRGGGVDLPYPILFVHGLIGNSTTWEEMVDWLGQGIGSFLYLDFCLNADGSLSTSAAEDDIQSFIPANLGSVNQYVLDFNCNTVGTCYTSGSTVQSNQSGIYKQGEAIGVAIDAICDATGKDKVILLGHSMGGVACREYLQNLDHWQTGQHRVAKLVTSGSPHVGVDFGSKIKKAQAYWVGIDVNSESFRDLKNEHTGAASSNPGVFFWGGEESQDYMYDDINYWYNVDVNSNGQIGNNITGLNERSMPNDLEFACLWDTYDIVVSTFFDLINWTNETSGGENLCSVLNEGWMGSFHCESWGWDVPGGISLGHLELPDQILETLWALDEPDDYATSYEVDLNTTYTGFVTPQADDAPYELDWDDYKVYVPSGGLLVVEASFTDGVLGDDMYLYDMGSGTYVNSELNVSGTVEMSTTVTAGWYIVEFSGTETEATQFSQYFFTINLETTSDVSDMTDEVFSVYPNPTSGLLNIESSGSEKLEYRLVDSKGRSVCFGTVTTAQSIQTDEFGAGVYFLHIEGNGISEVQKIVVQ